MSLEVKTIEVNEAKVVHLKGNLDTNTAPDAEKEINKWLENGSLKMVINLKDTNYVSSAGLRIFLATAKKMAAAGGVVKWCNANEVVQEILDISGFSTILDIKESEAEALSAL
ncbi:MAG: anti-sigma B factor antagonist [Patiriisocius sp.]|jgi:anti-sigma B factor antagonist